MPIALEEEYKPGLPVVKRTALDEKFFGAIIKVDTRNRLRRDETSKRMVPVLKDDGSPAKELVVTCMVLPGTTAEVGIKDESYVPKPGELVRLILKGKSFGYWIESKAELGRPVQVGDIVSQITDRAQVYDAKGNPSGDEIKDQATLNNVPRNRSVGIYGPIEVRPAREGSEWIE